MKTIRGFALGLALGIAATLSTVGIAQTNKQSEPSTKTESCCAMESSCCSGDSCCKGDSCSMANHAKHEGKDHSSKGGCCCCCSGDSCNIKMKDKQKQG